MAAKSTWAAFPHDAKGFAYAGDALKKAWPRLHAGDCEPFPDDKRAAALIKAAGKSAPKGMDAAGLATALQDAWRAFHRGDFKAAFEAGDKLGSLVPGLQDRAHHRTTTDFLRRYALIPEPSAATTATTAGTGMTTS